MLNIFYVVFLDYVSNQIFASNVARVDRKHYLYKNTLWVPHCIPKSDCVVLSYSPNIVADWKQLRSMIP